MANVSQTKFVIVTPGRVAYTTPAAKEKFTSRPKQVIWTPYLQELLLVHGDIQISDSPVKLMPAPQVQQTSKISPVKPVASASSSLASREPAAH